MKRSFGIGTLMLVVGFGLTGSRAWAVSIPIAYPSFDQGGGMFGGFEQGWWTGNGSDGGAWGGWVKYASADAKGGPYQALNTLYAANTTYTLTFQARLESGSNGKVNANFLYVTPGNIWYDAGYTEAVTETTVTSTDWTKFTLTYTTPASGVPIGSHIALSFYFPATDVPTQIWLTDVSLDSATVPIGDPSFENATLTGGFGLGWDNFGSGGGFDVTGYEGVWAYIGGLSGCLYQATNYFYDPSTDYTLSLYVRNRGTATNGKIGLAWLQMAPADTAYYNGSGLKYDATYTVTGSDWQKVSWTLSVPEVAGYLGKRIVLMIQFPGTTEDEQVEVDAVSLEGTTVPLQNAAFDVPASGVITADGGLSDWTASTAWSEPYIFWNLPTDPPGLTPLTSTTRAKFAWNDAEDMLYVAVQTDQANGGHVVIGLSKNIAGVPYPNSTDATQLCFDYDTTKLHNVWIRNEIATYGGSGAIDGVQAGCSVSGGVYTYEIAIPGWDNWTTPVNQLPLSVGDAIYVYACLESEWGSRNGTDLTYYGNPNFSGGAFGEAAKLTLVAGPPTPTPTPTPHPGDANNDGSVDVSDLGILAANYGTTSGTTWDKGDFNGDHAVDVSDLGILAANYGFGTGASLDFNADAKALGLTGDAKTDASPVTSALGCSPAGLPLIAGMLLAGLVLGGLKFEE